MPEEIPGEADGFDVEAALSAFLADATMMELKLPALETEQRKKAKKLAEEYPEIKCESYGFGPERRLHLFKPNPANLKGKETDSQSKKDEIHSAHFGSEGSTVISGVTSPEDKNEPGSEEGAGVALSPNVYQVRNTFIHIEGSDVVDQRAVQSMPHGMFSQCLQDEVSALPGSVAGTTAERGQPTTTFLVDAPKETFAPGTEVVIEGLTKYPAFNGLHGTVQSLDAETARYNVQLSSADGSIGQSAKIKGENLRMTVPPPPPFESTASRTEDIKSTMQARAPDFVPMQCMGMTSIPPAQSWQDHRTMQPTYANAPAFLHQLHCMTILLLH